MQPYAENDPRAGTMLPETERVAARVIVLPTGETIDPEAISKICEIIRKSSRQ